MDKGLIMSHIKTHDQPFIPLAGILPLLWMFKIRRNIRYLARTGSLDLIISA